MTQMPVTALQFTSEPVYPGQSLSKVCVNQRACANREGKFFAKLDDRARWFRTVDGDLGGDAA